MKSLAMTAGLIAVALLGSATMATAQDENGVLRLSMEQLIWVEPVKDSEPLLLQIPEMKPGIETRTREVPVTKVRTEQRTRTVNVDGKEVEQQYMVQVPYTETVRQTYTVTVSKLQASELPLSRIEGMTIDGKPVARDVLAKRLSEKTAAFVVDERPGDTTGVQPLLASVLRPDTLILWATPLYSN